MPVEQGDEPAVRRLGERRARTRLAARTSTCRPWPPRPTTLFSMRPDGTVDTIPSASVTTNFLTVLGVRAVLGRGFDPADEPADDAPPRWR